MSQVFPHPLCPGQVWLPRFLSCCCGEGVEPADEEEGDVDRGGLVASLPLTQWCFSR